MEEVFSFGSYSEGVTLASVDVDFPEVLAPFECNPFHFSCQSINQSKVISIQNLNLNLSLNLDLNLNPAKI